MSLNRASRNYYRTRTPADGIPGERRAELDRTGLRCCGKRGGPRKGTDTRRCSARFGSARARVGGTGTGIYIYMLAGRVVGRPCYGTRYGRHINGKNPGVLSIVDGTWYPVLYESSVGSWKGLATNPVLEGPREVLVRVPARSVATIRWTNGHR